MSRRKRQEESMNHEAWAVPYGDLITLLLAFFVVMYAMSSVNEGKYKVLSSALSEAFGGATLEDISHKESREEQTSQPVLPITQGSIINLPVKRWLSERPTEDIYETEEVKKAVAAQIAQSQALDRIGQQLQNALGDLVTDGQVGFQRKAQWLEVDIKADILFGSGSAEVANAAVGTLSRIADVLAPASNIVKVEGHTDNTPIQSLQYPSNWELSAARSASVVKLFALRSVNPQRLSVVGYGSEKPRADNATAEGRNANRRVVLVIMAAPDGTENATENTVVTHPLSSPESVATQELL